MAMERNEKQWWAWNRMMLTLVGSSDTTNGTMDKVDDQVQPQPEAESEGMKGEEEVQEEEKKAATG
jgi:hypothetical protein